MPTLTLDLSILDSRCAWFRTMARYSSAADSAVYSARSELARKYWQRALVAAWSNAPRGWSHAG